MKLAVLVATMLLSSSVDDLIRPFQDYQRFWHRDPPAITAIGIMQDTDMTGGMAISELRSLVWKDP